jgi:hypothetical protein
MDWREKRERWPLEPRYTCEEDARLVKRLHVRRLRRDARLEIQAELENDWSEEDFDAKW